MVFLADFVARGLGRGLNTGALSWVLFGLGALMGPSFTGTLADRIGFCRTLRLAIAAQAIFVGALAVTDTTPVLFASSVVVGVFVPGAVPLTLGRVHEIVHDIDARAAGWRTATIAFAIGQAAGAYTYSFLFAQAGSYILLFALACGALVLALVVDLTVTVAARVRHGRTV